jgi:hypothetical protein
MSDSGQIDELMIPLARKHLLAVLIQRQHYDKFDQTNVSADGFWRQPRFDSLPLLCFEFQSRNANAAVMDAIAAVHRDQKSRDALDNAGHFQRARINRPQARD